VEVSIRGAGTTFALAAELGLDLLLGGFAAGVITRQVLKEREVAGFEGKLTAVAFGVFIPFFFVVSGMQLDVVGGHMRASTAASLIGAAVLSTLCFPILGLRFSGDAETRPERRRSGGCYPGADRIGVIAAISISLVQQQGRARMEWARRAQ
jgi:Kef-type K+ transport system membrane component KefB